MSRLDDHAALKILQVGEIEVVGRLVASTNHAMLCTLTVPCPDPEPPQTLRAVYKPTLGERPLDDFPDGTLTRREAAAYLVSESTGWGIVPPTVLREGPFGHGMVQRWIEVDERVDVVTMVVQDDPRLRAIAIFDAVVNNTDRKGSHLLPVPGGHVHGVDHGVCFSTVPKLRTVLWAWRGEAFLPAEVEVLERLRAELNADLGAALRELLAPVEVSATVRRVERLLERRSFPHPGGNWPAVPWPPF
jgi:hypothetical protein